MMVLPVRALAVAGAFALLAGCSPDSPAPTNSASSPIAHTQSARLAPAGSAPAAAAPRHVVVNGIDLTGVGYDLGNPAAPIVLVNFSDFGCPFCGSFARETQPALNDEFIGTGKVFFKYVPFVMGMFPNGDEAARASECAAEDARFWGMHDQLYAGQNEWKRSSAPEPVFQRYAVALGMDGQKFAACYASGRTDARTGVASDRAHRLGIRATPTFFIGDRQVEGALPLAEFRRVLTEGSR